MPKIELITSETAPLITRSYFAKGEPSPIVSSLAHVPELLKPTLSFIGAVLGPLGLNLRTKEIVILRTSVLQQCHYCVHTHSVVAHQAGLSTEEILALHTTAPLAPFIDPKEKAILRWTNIVGTGAKAVSKDHILSLKKACSEAEIVELTMLIGATMMLNRYATALSLPISSIHQQYVEAKGLSWTP